MQEEFDINQNLIDYFQNIKQSLESNRKDIVKSIDRPPLHKGTKCDMRFKSSLNSARLNLLNPYK